MSGFMFEIDQRELLHGAVKVEDTGQLERWVRSMSPLEFFSMARRNPFRRVVVMAGDSVVAISQPIAFVTDKATASRWLEYLGHVGD